MLATYGAQRSSWVLHHHARMLAIALSQRAVKVLAPRPLMNSVSDAVLADASPEIVVHLFRRQLGCLQRMARSAAALRCIIMLGCRQMLCRREL
jgi:hypothetical protein